MEAVNIVWINKFFPHLTRVTINRNLPVNSRAK